MAHVYNHDIELISDKKCIICSHFKVVVWLLTEDAYFCEECMSLFFGLIRDFKEYKHIKDNAKKGYVYVLSDKNAYKIGRSSKGGENRIKELQTGNSNELELILEIFVEDYVCVEKFLHLKYKNKKVRRNGEWFNLNKKDIDDIKHLI